MRATDLIKDNSCPRTRATECSCSTIKTVTESLDTVIAQCDLQHSDTVKGTILFIQAPGTPTLIKGTVSGLEPGDHGFHIHEFGDMSKGCESMGAHYNPDNVDHGNEDSGHVGDLGNINAGKDGVATVYKIAKHVDLIGDRSVVGRGVVVHADPDDLGQGKNAESLKTGNAGDRLACGVIVLRAEKMAEQAKDWARGERIKAENLSTELQEFIHENK
jgi:Cu-Zn family superoxide dismutase